MILKIDNVCKKFRDEEILKNISFEIDSKDDDYVFLKGQSGSGKTTLLNIIAGLLTPDNGEILVCCSYDFVNIKSIKDYKNKYISYLPCGNSLLESLTVKENIMFAAECSENKLYEILDKLKIRSIENSYPREISSGEYKRACFARAIAMDTEFYLLDEPTSNLDEKSAKIIINIIDALKKEKGIILATHDTRLMKGKEICVNGC